MPEERLLTEAELLAALNVDVDRSAVWRWRQQGMPYVKVGRWNRYNLQEVRTWLKSRKAPAAAVDAQWPWSVWSWVPESRRPSGEIEPAFWYEECRCRNQADAENILKLFQMARPGAVVTVLTSRPEEIPAAAVEPSTSIGKP